MKKVKFLFLACAIVLSSATVFSQNVGGTTKTCDASNANSCVIDGVGTATGKLIVSNND